jgi:hypothetical protein
VNNTQAKGHNSPIGSFNARSVIVNSILSDKAEATVSKATPVQEMGPPLEVKGQTFPGGSSNASSVVNSVKFDKLVAPVVQVQPIQEIGHFSGSQRSHFPARIFQC